MNIDVKAYELVLTFLTCSSFLLHLFPDLAARSPSIAFHVSPRPRKHPVIRAHYINGATKSICVRNLEKEQVLQKVELLRDSSGVKNRKLKGGKFVQSANESVRGVWSGMHASAMNKDNIWGFNKTSQRS